MTKHSDALLDDLLWSQYPCGQSDLIIPPLLSYTLDAIDVEQPQRR